MAASEAQREELSPKDFAVRMQNVVDDASLSLALGIGDSLGIFNVMAKLENFESSENIAKEAGLNER